MVTGAGGSLGRLVSIYLASHGYNLALCSRSEAALNETVRRIQDKAIVYYSAFDATDLFKVSEFIDCSVKKFGKIDVIVNCLGAVNRANPLELQGIDESLHIIQVNLIAPFFLLSKLIPILRRQDGGLIINIASKAGVIPVPGLATYSASKAGLIALTEALAKELKGNNIVCISISPSGINSPMRNVAFGDAAKQQDPEYVASVITDIVVSGMLNGEQVLSGSNVLIVKGEVIVRAMEEM